MLALWCSHPLSTVLVVVLAERRSLPELDVVLLALETPPPDVLVSSMWSSSNAALLAEPLDVSITSGSR